MKKIYICHEYGGIYDNIKDIVSIIKQLALIDSNNIYISPILLFGILEDIVSYNKSLEYCLEILKDCDIMITFGNKSETNGCLIEKEFCNNHNIQIIEFDEFCKNYNN